MSHGWPASDLSNSAESPEYEPVTDDGMSMARCACDDRGDRVAQRRAARQIEADGDRRKLLLVRERSGAEMCSKRAKVESGTWLLPVTVLGVAEVLVLVRARSGVADGRRRAGRGAGAGDVELRQRGRVLLIARLRLQDHAVLVGLRIDRRNLALAEGVVERVVDRLHRDAEPAGGFAVDLDLHAQAALLRLRGDVEQPPILSASAPRASRTIRSRRRRRCRPACTDTARGSPAC